MYYHSRNISSRDYCWAMQTKLVLLILTLMFCSSPAYSADDESGPQMLDARLSSRGPFQVGDRFTITLVMQDAEASGVRNVQFQLKDKFGRQHGAENDDKLSFFSTPSFLCSGASICEYPFMFRIDETWANNGFITLSSIRAFDMKTNGTYFYDDGSIEDLQTRKKSSNQHALRGLSLQLGTPPSAPAPTPAPTPTQSTTSIDLDPVADAANAATDAALAAADAGDAAAAAAQDASDSARPDGRDLMTINTQIQNLDTGYKNAAATLAKISIELDKARAQITQFQKTMNAATNSAIKQRLAVAISKLANAVLVLNSSKTKLEFQVKVIESRKNTLLSARDQFISNSANSKTGVSAKPVPKEKTIVCTKGKSSLKVIGKNPKCPAGYKVKK